MTVHFYDSPRKPTFAANNWSYAEKGEHQNIALDHLIILYLIRGNSYATSFTRYTLICTVMERWKVTCPLKTSPVAMLD